MSKNNLNDEHYGNSMDIQEEQKYVNHSNNQELSNQGGVPNQDPQEEEPEEERFFKDFTNQDIDNNDPSLGNNLIKIYEEDVPFEIRYNEENLSEDTNNNFQSLLCKIFVSEQYMDNKYIKIEIASNKDLFFYYIAEINTKLFANLKEEQKLICEFSNFSDILIKYFDFCINNTKQYLAVLYIEKENKANLALMENFDFKCAELLKLNLVLAQNSLIRNQIIYRYNAMRATEDITQNRINIINEVLKDVDPQLILEVKDEITKSIDKNKDNNNKMDNNAEEKSNMSKDMDNNHSKKKKTIKNKK